MLGYGPTGVEAIGYGVDLFQWNDIALLLNLDFNNPKKDYNIMF